MIENGPIPFATLQDKDDVDVVPFVDTPFDVDEVPILSDLIIDDLEHDEEAELLFFAALVNEEKALQQRW